MSVIDARITGVRAEIDRLTSRATSYSISASEQKKIKREIQDLKLRLANLQAAKPFMVAVPPQQQAAYVVFKKERETSPTKPKIKENNGFGNGDQDAPGNSQFNNNAENAVGKK